MDDKLPSEMSTVGLSIIPSCGVCIVKRSIGV